MTRLICRTCGSGDALMTAAQAVRRVVERSVDCDRSGALEDLQHQHDKLIDLVAELFALIPIELTKDTLNNHHYETFRLE